jgi:ATP-dependent protease ClpP protease subunit
MAEEEPKEHAPQEAKKAPSGPISNVIRPRFGMSGSILASIGPEGQKYYVSVLDGEVTAPGQYVQLVDTLYNAKKGDVINLKIYSYGGWVDTGLNIIQGIWNTQAHVITTAMSTAASIAAVIWLCGHERIMMPGSTLMIHMPSGGQSGKTMDIADECSQLNEYFAYLLRTIGKGIVTEEEFDRIVNKREDTFLPAALVNERLKALPAGEERHAYLN